MDRQMEFVKMLEGKGVSVVTWFEEEGYHGMDLFVPHKTRDLLALLKEYVFSSGVDVSGAVLFQTRRCRQQKSILKNTGLRVGTRTAPHCQPSIDPFKELKIIYNSDDTLTRLNPHPCTTLSEHNFLSNQLIFIQDIPLSPTHKTCASTTLSHDFCSSMAIELPVVILSVDYRLAPECQLPTANYEDTVDALKWVRNQALNLDGENLLKDMINFSNCYLMGSSACGNIAYHANLQALSVDLEPLKIRGCILNQPYFSGMQTTKFEMRLINDEYFPLAVSDLIWELSKEYPDPDGDILKDKQMEFVEMLEGNGVSVVTWFEEEGYHGMDVTWLISQNMMLWETVQDVTLHTMQSDMMWELSLPKGSDWDHEYCNPMIEGRHHGWSSCSCLKVTLSMQPAETQKEILEPALTGTDNVLKASSTAKIKRVVVLSSITAVILNSNWPKNQIVDESCWSDKELREDTNQWGHNWYCLSKRLAESHTLEYGKKTGLDVVTACPSIIIGPMLQSKPNATGLFIHMMMKGTC
ncbi:hypothetical protein IFM89_020963 [Coptis chinensis]|uniref:Alpha/beta hydrolase fold-3 domain-containing protein n=1 Tax=Coptis chinensis TaxID=261450 RepID=A0A835IBN4_9MAGN|nr:hypothetical protein IFM89_020963 [Coptis chinensis]